MRWELRPGYTLSRLIKGGWHLAGGHGAVERRQAIADMAAFVQAGITTFDCADIYTGVEELIGEFRRAHPELAPQVQVHTKLVPDYDRLAQLAPQELRQIVERSRQRLGMQTIDLVQFHWWDTEVGGFVEAALELARMRQEGWVREVGLTNFNTQRVREMLEAGVPVATHQIQYSLIDPRPEGGLLQFCQQHGIGVLCYGTLAGGFISEAWLGQTEPQEPFENRSHTKYKLIIEDFGGWDWFQSLLQTLHRIAQNHQVRLSQVAVAWVLAQPGVAAAIVGATSARHLSQNLAILTLKLSQTEFQAIEQVRAQRSVQLSEVYDLERNKTGRHGRIMKYNLNQS